MRSVFGDAVYFIALANPEDQYHNHAIALSQQPLSLLLTTEWVLVEVGDALCHPGNRRGFHKMLELLRLQRDVEIVPASSAWFDRGVEFFAQRSDKEWSLTDCISFVVMQERGLSDALTSDHHFEQAGFQILLKD